MAGEEYENATHHHTSTTFITLYIWGFIFRDGGHRRYLTFLCSCPAIALMTCINVKNRNGREGQHNCVFAAQTCWQGRKLYSVKVIRVVLPCHYLCCNCTHREAWAHDQARPFHPAITHLCTRPSHSHTPIPSRGDRGMPTYTHM